MASYRSLTNFVSKTFSVGFFGSWGQDKKADIVVKAERRKCFLASTER